MSTSHGADTLNNTTKEVYSSGDKYKKLKKKLKKK